MMPQSVRDQIMQAIAHAKDEGERAILLMMLQTFDLWADATDSLRSLQAGVDALAKAHLGIPPETHVDHHAFVERRKRASDIVAEDSRKVRVVIIEKIIWAAVSGFAVWVMTK